MVLVDGIIISGLLVNNTNWDNGSGTLQPLTSGYYAKHSLYTVGQGIYETYILFISQSQYSTLLLAQQAGLPSTSPDIIHSVTLIADIIILQGASNTAEMDNQRPRIGFKPSSITASADHMSLLNLTTGNAGHLNL